MKKTTKPQKTLNFISDKLNSKVGRSFTYKELLANKETKILKGA